MIDDETKRRESPQPATRRVIFDVVLATAIGFIIATVILAAHTYRVLLFCIDNARPTLKTRMWLRILQRPRDSLRRWGMIRCMKQFLVFLAVGTVLRCSPGLFAQATQPADDAVSLYMQAAKLVNANCTQGIMSPAASTWIIAAYPPFPPEWQRLEEVDFPANQAARVLAHQADR